ncbi:hypothetical protein [Streptosporangium sp. KLBMP 9127]|nr:hypothetical protein [Streptosporangium sp. KLBMP 9127]
MPAEPATSPLSPAPRAATPSSATPSSASPPSAVSARTDTARVAHAAVRATGPLSLTAGVAAPPGMVRLARSDGTGLALPLWPDGVTPSLLEEYQVNPVSAERSGEARRVLAACLKCCWSDHAGDPWPGDPAPLDLVLAAYRALIGRNDDLMRNWAIGALRRLHDSAWVILSGATVRLGPRCATWPAESHAHLRELVRRLPDPEPPATLTLPFSTPPRHLPVAPGSHPEIRTPETSAPDAAITVGPLPSVTVDDPPPDPTTPSDQHAVALIGHPDGPAAGNTSPDDPDPLQATTPDAGHLPAADESSTVLASATGFTAGTAVSEEGWDDELLGVYDERRRAELVAAFMAVEHAAEPVQEARFAALRDPALRRGLADMLAKRGRTLIQSRERWTSGYDDATAAEVGTTLGETERAVLVLVLVHSVAIPRAEGLLGEDTWLSPHPTPVDELRRHTQLAIGELEAALRSLRHAGLLVQVKAGEETGGYVPGPQFHRFTPRSRRRLQEELILAAGPHTPLAEAVRARRKPSAHDLAARPSAAQTEADRPAAAPARADRTAAARSGADQAAADRASANQTGANRASADRAGANQASMNQASMNQASADQASPDRKIADRAGTGRADADQASADQASADQASADQASADRAEVDRAGVESELRGDQGDMA